MQGTKLSLWKVGKKYNTDDPFFLKIRSSKLKENDKYI